MQEQIFFEKKKKNTETGNCPWNITTYNLENNWKARMNF